MSFIGRQIDVGIGKETVRGTVVAPSHWLPALNKSVEDTKELAKDEAARGVIETAEDAKVVKVMSEGDIEAYVQSKSFGLLLLGALGTVGTTADTPEVGVHTHDFTVAQSVQHQSLSVAMKHPAENIRFANAMITSLEMAAELGEIVKYTASFMGFKGVDDTDTPAYDVAEEEFCPQHMSVKFAANLAGLAGATAIKAKVVNLTVNKNVETDDILGTTQPNDVLNKQFQIEGSVELLYEDTTFKDIDQAGTPQSMRINMTNSDVLIGAASNPSIEIDLAKVILEEWSRTSDNDGLISQTLNFQAYYSVADAKMVTVQVINTEATY